MSENIENIILFDWLSFTSKSHDTKSVVEFLGLQDLNFQLVEGRGLYGFQDRLYYDGISIHFNNPNFSGVWVEFSGQGCRVFETFSSQDFERILIILTSQAGFNITRLDIAYDDKIGILPIQKIAEDVLDENFVSKFHPKSMLVTCCSGRKGYTVGLGSKKSKTYFRIYDKAFEQGKEDLGHWVRFEIQLRDNNAFNFAQQLNEFPIGYLFLGVIKNYVRFIKPHKTDKDKRRWELRSYWAKFIKNSERISIYSKKKIDYNLKRCHDYVFQTCGNSIKAYVDIKGIDSFFENLLFSRPKQNPKYKNLVDEHKGDENTILKFLESRGALDT